MRLQPAPTLKGDPFSALDIGTGCGTGGSGNGRAFVSDDLLGSGAGASDVVDSGCNKDVVRSSWVDLKFFGGLGVLIGSGFPLSESLDSDPLERWPNNDFAFFMAGNDCEQKDRYI